MEQNNCLKIILNQTERALWEVENVIGCIPDSLWEKQYCHMPMWKHVYHMLHSLDLWFMNPRDKDYREPSFHVPNLNNLDVVTEKTLKREELEDYLEDIQIKITGYLQTLQEEELLLWPEGCEYTRFTLILAQFRHLHTHMGMIMGFIIDDTGLWPRVVGLEGEIPKGKKDNAYDRYF